MKKRKIFLVLIILAGMTTAVGFKLAANKQSLDEARKAGTSFNLVIPVLVEAVKNQRITTDFTVNGSFEPLREVTVVSEVQGRVIDILSKVGNRVNAGTQLARVESKVRAAQLEQAKSNYQKAKKDLERFNLLIKRDAISTKQFESVRAAYVNAETALVIARKQMENSVIRAPISGIITKRQIENGTFLVPGTPTFKIIDVNKVKLICNLTADQVGDAQNGQTVGVAVDSFSRASFEGKVTTVTIDADSSKRYRVEIEVSNRGKKLIRPGMFGVASFGNQSSRDMLVIPSKALTGSIKTPEVFIVRNNTVDLRNIVAEPINDQYLAVKEGLAVGDKVVVSGHINLENGSRIKIVNSEGGA